MRLKGGRAVPLPRSAGNPSNTMWTATRSTSVPSGVFIHPAVWPKGELIGDANVAARLSGDI